MSKLGISGDPKTGDFVVPADKCIGCGKHLDAAWNVRRRDEDEEAPIAGPAPGDPTICSFCGEVMVFNRNMRLEILTFRDLRSWPAEEISKLLRIWEFIRISIAEKKEASGKSESP